MHSKMKRIGGCVLGAAALALPLIPAAQTTTPGATASNAPAKAAPPVAINKASAPVCSGEFAAAASVSVPEGKSLMLNLQQLRLPAPAWLRTVGDTELLQLEPMTSAAPRSMFFLFGKKVGATNLMFQDRDGRCGMVEVSVGIDTASVQAKLNQLLPEEKNIRVSSAADSLVLSGTVSDALAVDKVMLIASAFVRQGGGAGGTAAAVPGAGGTGSPGGSRIVNMLSVASPQQVMLEVKVAEISKTLLDQLGVSLSGTLTSGSWATTLATNLSSGGSGVLNFLKTTTNEFVRIDAEKRDGLVKILAEPNIMAISGQEGSFLAGGKIFIPVAQSGIGGQTTITLEEKEFGVGLRFTPTVLDGGRINMKVAPEVSELSREGIGISSSTTGGNAILPLMTTRRAATTVQLYDGQSFAIGGLIKNNVTQNVRALPILGEVPVLGALFRSSAFQSDLSELVFIVTPRLVKALPPDYSLPTDRFIEPSRSEFFLGGKMEGRQAPAPEQSQSRLPYGFETK